MGETIMVLGLLLVVATFLGRAARLVGLPTVPVYILTGLAAGAANSFLPVHLAYEDVHVLAVIGLVLLLFHLGLEFDTAAFAKNARTLVTAGVAYIALNVGAGLLLGFALGWGAPEALAVAGITGISSSAIVTKLMFDLKKLARPEAPLILGIIVIEDVFLAVYLAVLNTVINPAGSLWASAVRFAVSVGFLVFLFVLARRGSKIVSRIVNEKTAELFVVGLVGITLFIAGMAEEVGVSDAIGAFMVGLIVAGTNAKHRAETTIGPLRDTFAAVFFVGFGLTLDPGSFGGVLTPVLLAVAVSIVVNLIAGVVAARVQDMPALIGAEIGLTLLSRGEFALIVATIAATAGLDERIMPFAGLYVLILGILGPLLVTYAPRLWNQPRQPSPDQAPAELSTASRPA
ncbi:cation:proton antiporter [Micromonospora craterilacus]|nr:cation:proton antiporter [Micromonospora craterilacus]